MTLTPELDAFRSALEALRTHSLMKPHIRRGIVHFEELTIEELSTLLGLPDKVAFHFLLSAAQLNRTSLKSAARSSEVAVVAKRLRQAQAVRMHLPLKAAFDTVVTRAIASRSSDIARKGKGSIEQMFRERLASESIPILMSPPIRHVPGLLVDRRKPDGVYPDPADGSPPSVYLEIKNIKRVSDDIQKRLYELAEASLEMKLLYGDVRLVGLGVDSTFSVTGSQAHRAKIRRMIVKSRPTVVGLFLCPKAEAERYRAGAETFVDRVFFAEEIEECLVFLREATKD